MLVDYIKIQIILINVFTKSIYSSFLKYCLIPLINWTSCGKCLLSNQKLFSIQLHHHHIINSFYTNMMQTSTSQFNLQSVNLAFNFCGQVYHVEEKLFTTPDAFTYSSLSLFLYSFFVFYFCRTPPGYLSMIQEPKARISEPYVQCTHDNDQIEMRSFLLFRGKQKQEKLYILRILNTFSC